MKVEAELPRPGSVRQPPSQEAAPCLLPRRKPGPQTLPWDPGPGAPGLRADGDAAPPAAGPGCTAVITVQPKRRRMEPRPCRGQRVLR